MNRVLFVTNGHGEISIADRLAGELRAAAPEIAIEHLGLVGSTPTRNAVDVGPRRRMPSGGLVAMGDVVNIARDLRAGLASLTIAQWRFLKSARGGYDAVVPTGDVFALWMALRAKAPTIFVGTAKSVSVAPYGNGERSLLRRAKAVFVRDEATAADLRRTGVAASAPGNVIADLYEGGDDRAFEAVARGLERIIAVLPGSRQSAYDNAAEALDIFAEATQGRSRVGAVVSIAPGIDEERMTRALEHHERVRTWRGDLGPLLRASTLVLGQAGTANEGAAAMGVPVVAVAKNRSWYRRRQAKLLGDALVLLAADRTSSAQRLRELLDDRDERDRRGAIGRARLGPPGGAKAIAAEVARIVREFAR
ncbi:MAG: hypothetical protein ACREMP_05475 [Candidatus Tyrphobacter sp.]